MNHRLAASLLRQGRLLDAWSRLVALLGGLLLSASFLSPQVAPWTARALLLGSVVLGLLQAWNAMRAGFDAEVFSLVPDGQNPSPSWNDFDQSLAALGLRKDAPPSIRDGASRARGALRLLKHQAAWLVLQTACLVVGVLLA